MKERKEHLAVVLKNEQLSERFTRLTMRCPEIASQVKPGQFVNLLSVKYLRRPIAVATISEDTFTVGIERKGQGTKSLAALKEGSEINILGPLGHGFTLTGTEPIVGVGGGTGIFPIQLALQEARQAGVPTAAVFGFRSQAQSFLLDELEGQSDLTVFTSDQGDLGLKGTVIAGLEKLWEEGKIPQNSRVLCVGPKLMMQAVARFAEEHDLVCEVSLEEHMACGVGLCLTCVCKIKNEDSFRYSRSCLEGPVYNAKDVVWEGV